MAHHRHQRRLREPLDARARRRPRGGPPGAVRRTRRARHRPPLAQRRDVGVRPAAADAADGVHGDRLLEPVQARVRLLLSPREAARHRVPSRVALLRPPHRIREPHALRLRRLALPPGPGRPAHGGAAGARDPVGEREPLSDLHPRHAPGLAGAGVTEELLTAALQLAVVGAGAPLVVGVIRTLKARLVGRRGPKPWQPYADLRKLFGKEAVVSTTTSWVFRFTPYLLV